MTLPTRLSVAFMMNGATPSASTGPIRLQRGLMRDSRSFNRVRLPQRNTITQTADRHWEITVAMAAPRTPMPMP